MAANNRSGMRRATKGAGKIAERAAGRPIPKKPSATARRAANAPKPPVRRGGSR